MHKAPNKNGKWQRFNGFIVNFFIIYILKIAIPKVILSLTKKGHKKNNELIINNRFFKNQALIVELISKKFIYFYLLWVTWLV